MKHRIANVGEIGNEVISLPYIFRWVFKNDNICNLRSPKPWPTQRSDYQ